jgi:hypothetical protein
MRLNARLLTAVLPAPVLVAGLMYLASAGAQPTNTQELSEIPQPQEWVPFAGQFLTTEPGRPDIVGKYYRSDDGSFREEQHAVDGSVAAISISNIAEASAYLYISRRGYTWVKQPMLLPPAGFKPQLRRSSMQGLTKHPRVVLGFDAYDYVEPTGTRHIQVPALNFFHIHGEAVGRATCLPQLSRGVAARRTVQAPARSRCRIQQQTDTERGAGHSVVTTSALTLRRGSTAGLPVAPPAHN